MSLIEKRFGHLRGYEGPVDALLDAAIETERRFDERGDMLGRWLKIYDASTGLLRRDRWRWLAFGLLGFFLGFALGARWR